jgi:hypothetical protein
VSAARQLAVGDLLARLDVLECRVRELEAGGETVRMHRREAARRARVARAAKRSGWELAAWRERFGERETLAPKGLRR